jgi:hypothetical protein
MERRLFLGALNEWLDLLLCFGEIVGAEKG